MKDNLIEKILLFLIIINPIFDLSFFYGKISTLIRIIIILFLFFLTLKNKNSKFKKYLFIYFLVVVIYFIIHHLNTLNFKSAIPGNLSYNILEEGLYFIKMIMSVILIYIIYNSKLKFDELNKPINISVLLVSLSIVVLNILKLSYSSYGFETISANVFSWFTNHNYDCFSLASKGYFEMANQVVALLLLYLPIIVYFYLKKFKLLNVITLILTIIALLMLGTRLSSYGSLLELIYLILLYLFFVILKKEKINYLRFIILVVLTLSIVFLIRYSPVKLKHDYYQEIYNNDKSSSNEEVLREEIRPKEDKLNYILNNYEDKKIYKEFIINSYPYQYDPDFWIEMMDKKVELRVDTRYLELQMIKRVKKINDNKADDFFGISYTRVMNVFNIEKDYVMQYYSLGIIGTFLVFLGYLWTIIYSGYNILFKRCFNFKNMILISSIMIVLLSAYFSGNILNSLGCIIPISFMCGVLLKEIGYDKIRISNYEVKYERKDK